MARSGSERERIRPTCWIGCGGRGCDVVCAAIEYVAGNPRAQDGSFERSGLFGSIPPYVVPLGIDAFRDPREHRRLTPGNFFDLAPRELRKIIEDVRGAKEPEIASWLEERVALVSSMIGIYDGVECV